MWTESGPVQERVNDPLLLITCRLTSLGRAVACPFWKGRDDDADDLGRHLCGKMEPNRAGAMG